MNPITGKGFTLLPPCPSVSAVSESYINEPAIDKELGLKILANIEELDELIQSAE
jgi:hypothetical protein